MYKKDQEEEISLDQNGEFHSSGINETVSFAIHLQLFFFNQNGEFCFLNKNSILFFEVPALFFEIEQEQSVIYIYIYYGITSISSLSIKRIGIKYEP